MSFSRPTLEELVTRIVPDISERIGGTSSPLRRAVTRIMGKVYAGVAHLMFGFLDHISNQKFPDTASSENLRRHASLYGVEPIEASYAEGNLTVIGSNGSVITTEAVFQRSDGVQYSPDSEATISSGTATVALTCLTEGETGNCDEGTVLTLVSPIAGVNSSATVASGGLESGADAESDESLLARLLKKLQDPPQGGSAADYEQWALEVPGVTRAWVIENYLGEGNVGVTFVRDGESPISPSEAEVDAVAEYIEPLRPVTADVTVFAPTLVPQAFTIELTPDTSAIRAAVTAELDDLFLREAKPGEALLLSHIRAAVASGAGAGDSSVTSPSADIESDTVELATRGAITWA